MALRRPLALIAGLFRELPAGDAVPVEAGGTGATSASGARDALGVREKLTAPRTYYVRTDGNDANDGLSNTAGGAFATIQKAVDMTAALDVSLFQVTIQVGAGTYAPFALKPYVGAVGPLIVGDTTTPANVLINATAAGVNAVVALDAGLWSVAGLKVQSTSASGYRIEGRTTLNIVGHSEFGACGSRHVFAYRSVVIIAANLRITGGAVTFLEGAYPGTLLSYTGGHTCTFVGTPAYSYAAIVAGLTGLVVVNGITFSGAVTGTRYALTTNGVIQTFSSGETYLPGNAPGVVTSGGIYQ